jgi:hypothetical protein
MYVLIALSTSLSVNLIALDENVDNLGLRLVFPCYSQIQKDEMKEYSTQSFIVVIIDPLVWFWCQFMPVARGFYIMFFIVSLLRIRDARFLCNTSSSGRTAREK